MSIEWATGVLLLIWPDVVTIKYQLLSCVSKVRWCYTRLSVQIATEISFLFWFFFYSEKYTQVYTAGMRWWIWRLKWRPTGLNSRRVEAHSRHFSISSRNRFNNLVGISTSTKTSQHQLSLSVVKVNIANRHYLQWFLQILQIHLVNETILTIWTRRKSSCGKTHEAYCRQRNLSSGRGEGGNPSPVLAGGGYPSLVLAGAGGGTPLLCGGGEGTPLLFWLGIPKSCPSWGVGTLVLT